MKYRSGVDSKKIDVDAFSRHLVGTGRDRALERRRRECMRSGLFLETVAPARSPPSRPDCFYDDYSYFVLILLMCAACRRRVLIDWCLIAVSSGCRIHFGDAVFSLGAVLGRLRWTTSGRRWAVPTRTTRRSRSPAGTGTTTLGASHTSGKARADAAQT